MWNMGFDDGLDVELLQAEDEGRAIPDALRAERDAIAALSDDAERSARAAALMDAVQRLPFRIDYPYEEPDELDEIKQLRPQCAAATRDAVPDFDRIHGAWLGRAAGCLLGNPIEGWRRRRILGFLRDTDNLPIRRYLSSDVQADVRRRYEVKDAGRVYSSHSINWINNVPCMPEDDDTNYTALALVLLEDYGWAFTSTDVASCWMQHLPLLHTYTAERAALRSFAHGVLPPRSASFRNPYREWIGAAIRADFYGYIAPGNPELAAELAWRDARISHVKNGIYGAMWVAATLAAAAVAPDAKTALLMGLDQVPARCRLAEALRDVVAWHEAGLTADEALDRIHQRYSDTRSHPAAHTTPTELSATVAPRWGGGELGRTIGLAVQGALDTDCDGATAGSMIGMLRGAQALEPEWLHPLRGRIRTRVDAMGESFISDLAARTLAIAVHGKGKH